MSKKMLRLLFLLFIVTAFESNRPIAAASGYARKDLSSKSVIVFVHGIFGNSEQTWSGSGGAYFPKLILDDPDLRDFNIYTYDYPTSFLNAPFSIDEISENMRLYLDADGVSSHKDIIFVAHSMGGLATRAYLLKNRTVAANVRLIYFYSTPTTGSDIAAIASLIHNNPQLAKMQPMKSADYLADLQRQWLAADLTIPSFCAYETRKTFGVSVVTQASASNLCNRRLDPIDADHISIAKPNGTRDAAYLAIKSAISITASLVSPKQDVGKLRKSSVTLSHEDMVTGQGYLHSDKVYHSAFVLMNVSFKEDRFNIPVFLSSFDSVSADHLRNGQKAPRTYAKVVNYNASTSSVAFLVMIQFDSRPQPTDGLEFVIGPARWQLPVTESSFNWKDDVFDRFDEKIPWKTAIAEVELRAENPDWLVISDAEILAGTNGTSLVRFAVTNASTEVRSLKQIVLAASEPFNSGYRCANPDPRQTMTLRWEKVIANKPDAVTTDLFGVQLPVETTYNFVGTCSHSFSIIAKVPVDERVESKTTKQILLKILELPPRPTGGRASRGDLGGIGRLAERIGAGGPPTELRLYDKITINVVANASTDVVPRTLHLRNTEASRGRDGIVDAADQKKK